MGILDPNWKYTPSVATDIRKTFAKARGKLEKGKTSLGERRPGRKVAELRPRKEVC